MATPSKNLKGLKKGRATAINTVNTLNKQAIKLTEELIEGSVATGTKYQKLATSTLKKSEPIMEKNIDMAFDTVEALYGQMISANKRLQKLFGIEKTMKNAKQTFWSTYKSTSKNVEKNLDDATNMLKAAANEIEENMEVITERIMKTAKTVKAPKAKKVKKVKSAKKMAKKAAKKAGKTIKAKKVTAKKAVKRTAKTVKPVAEKTTRKATTRRRATSKATQTLEGSVTVVTSKRAAAAKRSNAAKKTIAKRKPTTRRRTTAKK